jgi:regulator of ribosome biosynthesis
LPNPKPQTKREKFAAAKGIQKGKRDRKIFDEEKQEWVDRWGRGGKNHEKEEQWITELLITQVRVCFCHVFVGGANGVADPEFDPAKAARDERKARVSKNEKQQLRNFEHAKGAQAQPKDEHKRVIEKTLVTSRISTASMGK